MTGLTERRKKPEPEAESIAAPQPQKEETISPGEMEITNAVFSMVSRTEQFSGKKIYKYVLGEERWEQSEFLSMELAGDMFPTNGGIEMWRADETAYLLTRTEYVSQIDIENEIVSEEGTYCIVMHK